MKTRGFTLIELMVVVVIIGILSAIAIPNYIVVREKARQASVKENMHAVQTCVCAFAVDNSGIYPSDVDTPGEGFGYYFPGGDQLGQSKLGTFPINPYSGGQMVVADFVIFNYGASGEHQNTTIGGPNDINLGGPGLIGYGRWSGVGAFPWTEYGLVGSKNDGNTIRSGNGIFVLHN